MRKELLDGLRRRGLARWLGCCDQKIAAFVIPPTQADNRNPTGRRRRHPQNPLERIRQPSETGYFAEEQSHLAVAGKREGTNQSSGYARNRRDFECHLSGAG